MPEPQTPATPQAGGTGDTSAQAATPTSSDALAADEPISLEDARKLRSEAINLRKREKEALALLKGYQDKEEAAKLAAMGDLEKAQKINADAQKQIQTYKDQLVLEKVVNAAHKAGIIDPELAALAVKGQLEFDDNGMPTNLDKALEDLVKNKPYLKAPEPGSPHARVAPATGANNPGRAHVTPPGTLPPGQTVSLSDLFRRK